MLKSTAYVRSLLVTTVKHPFFSPLATLVIEFIAYAGIVWVWQHQILPAEKGLYSPFQNGLSLARYVGLCLILNSAITLSALRRQSLWVWVPIVANIFLLTLCGYYLIILLRIS